MILDTLNSEGNMATSNFCDEGRPKVPLRTLFQSQAGT